MLLSKTVLSYEIQLKALIQKDPTNTPHIKRLLREAVTACRNESKTLRYLRLWLYLAALYRQPLNVYHHLLDNNIGTCHALLYQDMAYYYVTENRKDTAKQILKQGISQNAQPHEHLQQSLMNLHIGHHGSAPPSVHAMLTTSTMGTDQAEVPLFVLGLGSEPVLGVLDAMQTFIQQMARISIFEESEHYDIPFDRLRAEASAVAAHFTATFQITGATTPMVKTSSLAVVHSSTLQPTESRDMGKHMHVPATQGNTMEQQQPKPANTFMFPLSHSDKHFLIQSYLPLDATYALTHQPENLASLDNDLQIHPVVPLTLNQDTVIYVQCMLGQGSYGTVYRATWHSDPVAIKIYDTPDQWDHYLHQHIFQKCPDADRFFIRSRALYLDDQISILVMDYVPQGTLLDCLNVFRDGGKMAVPEPLVLLLVLRLFQAISLLHTSHITHNDLKLDNILMSYTLADTKDAQQQPSSSSHTEDNNDPLDQLSIKVIDFSLSINLKLFTPSSTATTMNDNRDPIKDTNNTSAIYSGLPWQSFHLDYWGIANCAHTLLFSTPLINGTTHDKLKRYWNISLWQQLFDILVTQPPPTLEEGMVVLGDLVTSLTSSLANRSIRNQAINHLHYYDCHYHDKD